MSRSDQHLWWQKGVLYQIYPRSFQDSNDDGCGDLKGIEKRLDYLKNLGVDAVWLSPIFPSPMADFGYDVADYTGIDPAFGTLADFDALLAACHERGLKLLLDFVPNHSSDQHPWFVESRSGRHSRKRDWYIWADPAEDGGPPNNWLSVFGSSAWEFDESSEQYYYHAFLKEQPDLNWRNDEVREAMLDVLRFWFDRGVDGFRIDVLWHIIKDSHLRDNPANPDYEEGDNPYDQLIPMYSTDQPEVHEIVSQMRAVADEYDDRVLIGEVYLPIERLMAYYGRDGNGVHLPLNFQLLSLPWEADEIRAAIDHYEDVLPPFGWPNWVLGNHDNGRIASRIGEAQARVAAVMLLTLRGTPIIYYGDELGMTDGDIPTDRLQDPQGLRLGSEFSRDPSRTPMQWDDSPGGGFTRGDPWLPVNSDSRTRNVADQTGDSNSILEHYRTLLRIRRSRSALSVGDYVPLTADGSLIAYLRRHQQDEVLVVLNLSDTNQRMDLSQFSGTVIYGTDEKRREDRVAGMLHLHPDEALIIGVSSRR